MRLGNAGAPPEAGPALPSAHLLTPETETRTHYFWMVGRNRLPNDHELGQNIHAGIARAFTTEDEPMISRVSENMNGAEFWSLKPAILPGDAAALRHLEIAAAFIVAAIEIIRRRNTALAGGLCERIQKVPAQPWHVDMPFAARAVEFRSPREMVLLPAEIGEDIVPPPPP